MTQLTNPLSPYREERLKCGSKFVCKEVSSVPVVAIDIWISAGAVDDPEEYLGLSHFYEHMFFKGTENMGVGEMDRAIKGVGGYNNAATGWDYTHYYVVAPSPGWRRSLEVLIDALRFPLFDPDEIESERQVIFEEIKRHEDTPWSKFYQEYSNVAFAHCPYSRQILGSFESLSRIQRNVFQDYLQSHYIPENITFVVAGNINGDEVRDQIETFMDGVTPSESGREDTPYRQIDSPKSFDLEMNINQSYLLLGHPTVKTAGTRDEAIMDLASILLGEGRSSRLHNLLKEELGLVSSINVSYWSQAKAGLFITEAVTDMEKLPEVEERIRGELKGICTTAPNETELNRIKQMALADYAFSNETMSAISHTYGSSQILSSIDHAIRYPEMIQSIKAEEISEKLNDYLNDDILCVGHLLPKNGKRSKS